MAQNKKQVGWRGKIPFIADRPANEWELKNGSGPIVKGGQLGYGNEAEIKYNPDNDYSKPGQWGHYWVDNFVFEDTIEFDHCSRGRSAATFHFKRSDGSKIEFMMHETTRLFPYFRDGKVTGKFTFIKRGTNYSCSIIDPSESE